MAGDCFVVGEGLHALQVDANGAIDGERDHAKILGMRDIEAEAVGIARGRQLRLSVRSINERDAESGHAKAISESIESHDSKWRMSASGQSRRAHHMRTSSGPGVATRESDRSPAPTWLRCPMSGRQVIIAALTATL